MLIAAGHDGDSPPDTYAGGSAVHSRSKAFHDLTAAAPAAGGAYHSTNGAAEGVRVAFTAASANRAVPVPPRPIPARSVLAPPPSR